MGKQKRGKENSTPSPTMKAEQKRHLEEEKEKEKKSEKKKPAPRSSLGSEKGKSVAEPAGRQTPMERSAHFSPEGAPLFSNPRINPAMGVPHTLEGEKWAIKEILAGRRRGPTQPEDDKSSSDEAEEPPAKVPRCMAKDLVAKKKTTGGASKRRERSGKGGVPGTKGKKMPPKKVPSKSESGRKYGGKDTQATQWSMAGGFQHRPGYSHTDPQGMTYDKY